MKLPSNLVVVDVETSGESPFVHDLLSLALVPVSDDWAPIVVNVRQADLTWSEFAERNFRLFQSEWNQTAVSAPTAVTAIDRWVKARVPDGRVTLVGHNVGFDIAFLRKLNWQANSVGPDWFKHRSVDTHTMLYLAWMNRLIPQEALSSEGAFTFFDIQVPTAVRHTALGDAIATKSLFLRLVDVLLSGGVALGETLKSKAR